MHIYELEIRQCDDQGCGHFGASRGSRLHVGIDLCCDPSTSIKSPVSGRVTKIGWPYDHVKHPDKTHLRYVEVTQGDYRYRVYYVNPTVVMGQQVTPDTVVGCSQGLGEFYPGISEHVHFEIKNKSGNRVDPTPVYLALRSQ